MIFTPTDHLIKMDCLGRLTVSREHREALLDEFERGTMSGLAFARHHGINYQTFASWMQKRRQARGDYEKLALVRKVPPRKSPEPRKLVMTLAEVAMAPPKFFPVPIEAKSPPASTTVLRIDLPNGVSIELSHRDQLPLLVDLLEKIHPSSRC
jgi:transposase